MMGRTSLKKQIKREGYNRNCYNSEKTKYIFEMQMRRKTEQLKSQYELYGPDKRIKELNKKLRNSL